MSTDPTPAPAPEPSTWERIREGLADGIHGLENFVRPGEETVEAVAKVAWGEATATVAAYLARNKEELGQKVAAKVVAFIIAQVPGLSVDSAAIANFAVNEVEDMASVLINEMKAKTPTPVPPVAST